MIISAALIVLLLAGCELSKYPLILDASGKSKTIRVDWNDPDPYTDSVTISIDDLADLTDYDIDSVRFYNLTLHITNDTSDAGASISGEISVEGITLVTITSVEVTAFHKERSIFDKTLTGYSYNKPGVLFLLNALRNQSPSEIKVKAILSGDAEMHFDLTVTLYAQVFANP